MNWHDKNILVLGAGDTGLSVVRWAERVGARVRVADTRANPPGLDELRTRHPGVEFRTGPLATAGLGDAELIVASPGVAVAGPACDPAIAHAKAAGKVIVGDIELFAQQQNEIREGRPKVIGITGSNGKSTVTAMAGAMCAAAGKKTVVAGNIGLPLLDTLEGEQPDVYVIELSSFQLETTESLQADSAAMLNLSQDHLDRYASMADYAAAKQRIFLKAHHQVLNRDDPASLAMHDASLPLATFGETYGSDYTLDAHSLIEHGEAFFAREDMPVAGTHNALNALAAYALCRAIRLPREGLVEGLKNFKGLPHRLENVGRVDGVDFYDDSKGTNVGATVAALNGMTVPVILIAGGEGKEQDFSALAEPIRRRAKGVVLIGKDARLIESAVTSSRVQITHAQSMQDAVAAAHRLAAPGDAVLLSPACASFDMFKNYHHRGQVFAACVRDLQTQSGGGQHAV